MKKCAVLYALLALIPFFMPATTSASMPENLWIVNLDDGRTIEDAWAVDAEVLDRAAGLLVIGDAKSAARLSRAGFEISEAIATHGRTDLVLLVDDGHEHDEAADPDDTVESEASTVNTARDEDTAEMPTDGDEDTVELDGGKVGTRNA